MNDTMDALVPLNADDKQDKVLEITPKDYVEAPCMLKTDKKYILMYSSGSWTDGTYCVKTAVSDSPLGPFIYDSDILKASPVADGPGHNSFFIFGGKTYIAHRRKIGDTYPHNRQLCIDEMTVNGDTIEPIVMT